MFYEDLNLKQKALDKIPIGRLTREATFKFNSYAEQIKKTSSSEKPYDLKDFLLLELLAWFKNEFFSWLNEPDCDYCNSNRNMKFKIKSRPESHEVQWLAGNVEVYE